MAGSVTVSTLRTRIRQRADQEHSGSDQVTDTEILGLMNTSYPELYGHLVRSGLHMAETTYSITADGRTTTYDLPADFYAMLNVYRVESGEHYRLVRFDLRHKPSTTMLAPAVAYRVVGSDIEFSPRPSTGTYQVVYVPLCSTLAADGDTVDGVLGWEEYIVLDVAIKILDKLQLPADHLRRERAVLLERIKDEAGATEMTETFAVAVTRFGDSSFGDPAWPGDYVRKGYRGPL